MTYFCTHPDNSITLQCTFFKCILELFILLVHLSWRKQCLVTLNVGDARCLNQTTEALTCLHQILSWRKNNCGVIHVLSDIVTWLVNVVHGSFEVAYILQAKCWFSINLHQLPQQTYQDLALSVSRKHPILKFVLDLCDYERAEEAVVWIVFHNQ